jgi:hypothetical protein
MRMPDRILRTLRSFAFACALAACAAPATSGGGQQDAVQDAPAAAAPDATTPATAAPAAPAPQAKPDKPMRTGGPLPADPVEVDFSCQSDADCAVKNVGNCCGYYPACVNRNSPTDPQGVQAQCAKKGMMSVCGFQEIASCTCQAGRCEGQSTQVVQ